MGKLQKESGKSKVEPKVSEIRNLGDGETIVLYTEDNNVYQAVKEKALEEVPYEVWKNCDPSKASKVAADLYFNKGSKVTLKKIISQLQKEGGMALRSARFKKLLQAI